MEEKQKTEKKQNKKPGHETPGVWTRERPPRMSSYSLTGLSPKLPPPKAFLFRVEPNFRAFRKIPPPPPLWLYSRVSLKRLKK